MGDGAMMILGHLASSEDPKVIVVFAIRSDAYDALEQAKPARRVAAGHAAAARLCRAVLDIEVIQGPAQRLEQCGGKLVIDPRLSPNGCRPTLKPAAVRTRCRCWPSRWEQLYVDDARRSGVLKLGDYEAFGGLRGRSTRSWSALSNAQTPTRAFPENGRRDCGCRAAGLIPRLAGIDPDSKSARRHKARRSDILFPEAAPLIVPAGRGTLAVRGTPGPNATSSAATSRLRPSSRHMRRFCGSGGS